MLERRGSVVAFKRAVVFSAAVCVASTSASACLWDRDTLAAEVNAKKRQMLQVVRVITGRFERNPPLYFEMRVKRVAEEVQQHPEKLELYDDAAVACDRMGRGDEAIEWIEKKRSQLERMPKGPYLNDAWYRYYANAGTFHAHRWVRNGAVRTELGDLKLARDMIAAAMRINMSAHFGREKYQLMAIEWLLNPPPMAGGRLPDIFGPSHHLSEDAAPAVEGLSGLIALGNAWESVDIFNALTKALLSDEGRSSVAYLAYLRACELADAGRPSALPGSPKGAELKKLLIGRTAPLYFYQKRELERTFSDLREEAEKYQTQRTAYMMARLQAGRHPDTDPNFWNDYREPEPPEFRDPSPWRMLLISAGSALAVFAIGFVIVKRRHQIA